MSECSEISAMCKRYNVEMKSPPDVEAFLQLVDDYTKQKGKAVHLLFNDIESDILDKHGFLTKQQKLIESMVDSYKNLIATINVFHIAARMFNLSHDLKDFENAPSVRLLTIHCDIEHGSWKGKLDSGASA